jgi:mono/diheme cytochrome c family protein
MKTKKFLLILTVSLLTGILLSGCGTQASTEPAPTQAPQNTDPQPATVTPEIQVTETPVPTETDIPTDEPTPTEAPTEAANTTISFVNDVYPIFDSRCVNCHGGQRIEEGLIMLSYDELMAGSKNGPVILPGDVEGSLLVELIANQEMPKRGPKLTPPQVQIITKWVAAGAPNN